MESIYTKKTEDTPEITLDKEKGIFSITGNSYPDDPVEVYKPAVDWLKEYVKSPNDQTIFDLQFSYMNTSSSKQVVDMMSILEEIPSDKEVIVNWHYDKMDEDMEFEGETLQSKVNVKIELIGF